MEHPARTMALVILGLAFPFTTSVPAVTGPKYEFPSNTSAGVHLELKETSREKVGKVTYVYYQLSASGFTPGKTLNLYQWVWTLKDGILAQSGYLVDDSGNVGCSKQQSGDAEEAKRWCQSTLDETKMAAAGFQRGQVFRVGVISADGEQKAFVETIPFPIEIEENGCRLHAERLSENADSWFIVGDGFKPGDSIHYSIKGPGNTQEGDAKLSDKGGLAFMIKPPSSGTLSGSATVKVEASTCKPVLRFKWGTSAIELP